jgi:hypothetical protein
MTQPCPRQTHEAVLPSQLEHKSRWREDGACSYCGSMHPEALFAAIEAGEFLTPTDKSYKVYVGGSKKFYFQHLSHDEQLRFIQLYNSKQMQLAYPGYFYVMPFFCAPNEEDREPA